MTSMSQSDDGEETTNIYRPDQNPGDTQVKTLPCLVLVSGPQHLLGRQWVLRSSEMRIGRSPDADIHIADDSLSKAHAQVSLRTGKCFIADLGSTNRTIINGKPLVPHQQQPLENNDQIKMGRLTFKFLQGGIVSETKEKERMQSELEMARAIQDSLLPAQRDTQYQWIRVGGRYLSATEIGGDWWWHWGNGDHAYAIIADATGHGAAAAMITSAARSAVATVEGNADVRIEEVYAIVNHAIHQCTGGKMAMSAFLVEINLQSRQVRYVNASHVPPVLLPNVPNLAWKDLNYLTAPVSPSLGSEGRDCEVGAFVAAPGNRLVLLTDGLVDRSGYKGATLQERLFNKMLIAAHDENRNSQSGFLDTLLQRSEEWAKATPLKDDITVVAIDFT
jgi:pSer/pThr/pTyr-binding forkhead associated (FHA) protein